MLLCSSADVHAQTHIERWRRRGGIEFVCACVLPLLFTPPQPGGSPPLQLKGGDCAFIGMEAAMAGGRRRRRVRVIECSAWRRKRETERREREGGEGEGWAALCLKTGRIGGGEGEEQTGRRGGSGVEVRGGWRDGWLAPWLGCVCGERGWS